MPSRPRSCVIVLLEHHPRYPPRICWSDADDGAGLTLFGMQAEYLIDGVTSEILGVHHGDFSEYYRIDNLLQLYREAHKRSK